MKRPNTMAVPRPKSIAPGAVRTRKEAAIRLVRLEFDIARLERAINLADQRKTAYSAELSVHSAEREKLMGLLKS